jgi:hypothetical protein
LAGELNLEIRDQMLDAVSGHDEQKYIEFLLRQPRAKSTPFLSKTGRYGGGRREKSYSKIDVFNPNDNNWWCGYSYNDIENSLLFQAWEKMNFFEGFSYSTWSSEVFRESKYHNKLKDFLSKHPYTQFVDKDEVKVLENIPSAPQYLSEKIIDRENSIEFWSLQSAEEKERNAANLHYAVRSTRYGCKHNGPHGEYSKKAFRLLHKHYGSSIWAQNTPYWFNIGHRH